MLEMAFRSGHEASDFVNEVPAGWSPNFNRYRAASPAERKQVASA
jgi:hypothetical protein